MAREKGMGSLQLEKSGRWTARICVDGLKICRSTRTKDRAQAEAFLMRMLAPFGRGEKSLALADVWRMYEKSPKRRDLAPATIVAKRGVWMHFASWMEVNHPEVVQLKQLSQEIVGEYLRVLRIDHTASTYNNRVCVLREVCRVLANDAGIVDDPWEGVRLLADDSHTRREFTKEELQRLLRAAEEAENVGGGGQRRRGIPAACKGSGSRDRNVASPLRASTVVDGTNEWRLLFLLGIYTGQRLGDCCTLRWCDVKEERGIIQLIPRKTRKHMKGVPVTIPIHPELGVALEEQRRRGIPAACKESETRDRNVASPLCKESGTRDRNVASPLCKESETRDASPLGKESGSRDASPLGASLVWEYVLPNMARWYLGGEHWRISRGLEEIFKRAGIKTSIKIEGRKTATPDATFHSLRHTFVSFAVNGGVPLPVVQSIVGHSSNAMTRHYYHENEEVLRKAIAAIPSVGVGDEVKVEGEDEQRRRGIPAACKEFESRDRNVASPLGEESESRDNYVASPLAVTLPRREVTPGTMSGCSPLTAEMLGELRKMYEVLREVFG